MIKCKCFGIFKSGQICGSIKLGGFCKAGEDEEGCEHQTDADEEWKWIEGFEDYYEVSNFGNVRSVDRVVEDRLGVCRKFPSVHLSIINHEGSATVHLSHEGKHFGFQVSHVVWRAFIDENVPHIICHHDGDVFNNCPANLYGANHELLY
jgi:hypothetical protein